jgi:phosphoglycolate phosphatase-like HAD superfamily hydrolase
MQHAQRLALFDVDCTLIDAHGAGGRAIYRAIFETYGVSGGLDGYSFHGRTDPAIVVDLATRWGTPEALARERLAACLERYVESLRDEVGGGVIEVLPGVRELVTALAADRRVVLGLLTGNVTDGAKVKLAPTGLAGLFKVIADGSDSGHRPDLPAIALQRAEEFTGRRFAGKEIVIIGDTPADILCGADHAVKTIAVATGKHSLDELAEHHPDFLFPDFSDWRRAYDAILA